MPEKPESKNKESDPLAEARKLKQDGYIEECLVSLKKYWLANPNDAQAAELFSTLMSESGRTDLSEKLRVLSEKLAKIDSDASVSAESHAREFFEAGFGLIDARQHELAAMLLNHTAQAVPDEPTVNYELGFSLMSLGRIDHAITYFERALAKVDDFDTRLNLAVCFTLMRNIPKAEDMLKKVEKKVSNDEERRELEHRKVVLRRLGGFKSKQNLNNRDWLYILYGSILLNVVKPKVEGENDKGLQDYQAISSTLLILRGVSEGLRLEYEVVESYNTGARILADPLAELMEIPSDPYKGPDRPERALLLINQASELIGPHRAFESNSHQRNLFAYALSEREPLPVCPEIVGCISDNIAFPKSKKSSDDVRAIVERGRYLEPDPSILQTIQECVEYYSDKLESLVIANPERFPFRPEYTAEIRHD